MKIEYKSNRLRKQFSSASEIKIAFGVNAKRIAARLDDILASPSLAVLIQLPGAKCHPLSGARDGQWAVHISGNDRLIFILETDPIPLKVDGSINTHEVIDIRIVEIEDYH